MRQAQARQAAAASTLLASLTSLPGCSRGSRRNLAFNDLRSSKVDNVTGSMEV